MDPFEKRKLKLYGVFWLLVFVIPTLPLLWGTLGITGHFSSFEEIKSLWLSILPVFVLFFLHNFLVLPLQKRSTILYFAAALALIILFGIFCFTVLDRPPGMADKINPEDFAPPSNRPARPASLQLGFGVLAILVNYGGNAIVEQQRKEEERRRLEIDNLKLQLEALRYQINPHFFLNTLNNIQALVLIDPDKAVDSIGVFSKMMQLVLRAGNSPVIPLSDEVCFMDYLVKLMRLRYPENVSIEFDMPEQTAGAVIQPMILTTFAENAFKHGISYEHPSFVRISVVLGNETIIFSCDNSLHTDSQAAGLGIGLENARKRLALLYGDGYTLDVSKTEHNYNVRLVIPSAVEIPE